jgi:5'-nucleotidase
MRCAISTAQQNVKTFGRLRASDRGTHMLFRLMTLRHRTAYALVTALPLFSAPTVTLAENAPAVATPLNIALTNDDGWSAIGVQTVHQVLVAAGHTVVLVGSSENQSGMSAAGDLGVNNLRITKRFEDGNPNGGSDQYSLALATGPGAKPATSGLMAISIAERSGRPVDLLISGTNLGANIGAWTNISGTVGAAIHALSYLKGRTIPAIAISTDERFTSSTCPAGQAAYCEEANREHFTKVANWLASFIATLQQKPGALKHDDGLLPPHIGLNINYPTYVISGRDAANKPIYSYVEEIRGVALTAQGKLGYAGGIPRAYPLGCYTDCVRAAVGTPAPAGITSNPEITDIKERPLADTLAFSEGKVTIVPFTVDITADIFSASKFIKLVHELNRK